jgi:predicted transposase YdaD
MKYDTTLKELLQTGLPGLWRALGLHPPTELLTVELPSVQLRKPDFLARFDNGAIIHLELQGQNDGQMEWRELEYYQLVFRLFRQPPIQIVLYFGTEPMTMKNHIVFESLQFRYRLIDLRAISTEYLYASEAPGDSVLAILAEAGAEPEGVKRIVQELGKLPAHEQRDWFEKLMILAGVRGVEQTVREEVQKMGISLDIRDNLFFKEAYAAGIEDGMEKGMEKGEAAILRRLLERRFGSLPEWAQQRIEQANRVQLEELGLRLLDAAQLEDIFNGHGNGGS